MKKRVLYFILICCIIMQSSFPVLANTWTYEHNRYVISNWVYPDDYIKKFNFMLDGDKYMYNLSQEIVGGETDDYQKLKLIYEWVTDNIYYDCVSETLTITQKDCERFAEMGIEKGSYAFYSLMGIVSRRGRCGTYSGIINKLLSAQGILSKTVVGEIRDREGEQTWNAAFVDGRWVMLDAAMDCGNQYIADDVYIKGESTKKYFDISVENMSEDHFFRY